MSNTNARPAGQAKRFFAYYKVDDPALLGKRRALCRALVVEQGGLIVDDASDVGPGVIVDMPGYVHLYDALDRGTVDAFVTDMTVFGPTMVLGLFAMCTVNGIEMWDLARGRVTAEQIRAVGESLRHGLDAKETASTVKRTSMELGGNAPFIVFDDADIDAAVKGALAAKYRNAGQTCVCINRIFAQDNVYDAFVERFAKAVTELKVGDGFDPDVAIGPLISHSAVERVEAHIADATSKGARIAAGGGRHHKGGTFFQPTVLLDVNAQMQISSEEVFGPVAPVFRFKTEDEVIRLANDTEYGLAAYFYGRDIGRVWRVAEALEYGMVGINEGLISTEIAPFGGWKESGNGREGSKYGIEDYLEVKYLCMGGI